MALTLVSEPTRTVNGILSNTVALKSQIPFEFLRQDYAAAPVTLTGVSPNVNIVVSLDATNLTNVQVGDNFYLEFAGVYDTGYYAFVQSYAGAGAFRFFEFAIPYTSDTTCNVNALGTLKNYNVVINFIDNPTGLFLFTSGVRYTPKQTGELFVDLSGLFFGYQPFEGALDFKITYAESWDGVDQGYSVSNDYLGLPAKKQLLNDGGSNMWEYLPNVRNEWDVFQVNKAGDATKEPIFVFADDVTFPFIVGDFLTIDVPPYKATAEITVINDVLGSRWVKMDMPFKASPQAGVGQTIGTVRRPAGKFLTAFENPKQWLNYKKTFNWIFDDNLVARTGNAAVAVTLNGYDSSGSLIYTDSEEVTTVGLKTYTIEPTEEVSYFELSLDSGGVASDVLTINQELPCKNPLMIEWQNKQGVFEQYLFNFNQSIIDTVKEGLITESPITQTLDLESDILSRLPIGSNQSIQLLASNLDANTFNALKQIKASELVYLFLDVEGNKKISVAVVGDYTSIRETDSTVADFGLRIKLPTDFEIENAWQ